MRKGAFSLCQSFENQEWQLKLFWLLHNGVGTSYFKMSYHSFLKRWNGRLTKKENWEWIWLFSAMCARISTHILISEHSRCIVVRSSRQRNFWLGLQCIHGSDRSFEHLQWSNPISGKIRLQIFPSSHSWSTPVSILDTSYSISSALVRRGPPLICHSTGVAWRSNYSLHIWIS